MRFRKMVALLLIITGSLALGSAETGARFQNISWMPEELHGGSVCLFTVELDRPPSAVTATWLGREVAFFRSASPRVWYALAGADVEATAGRYELAVKATMPSGSIVEARRSIDVGPSEYKTVTLKVPQKFIEPSPEELKEIAADKALKDAIFAHRITEPLWSRTFRSPVDAPATASFGTKRIFNGKVASIHRGTDFRARVGTPIVSANSGQVVLARKLFYEGNCVIIDHGLQFLTMYMHLSKIEVEEGSTVRKGERLGLSGDTGRVTGPHLHMAVRWEGAYLDPRKLLRLTLPVVDRSAR